MPALKVRNSIFSWLSPILTYGFFNPQFYAKSLKIDTQALISAKRYIEPDYFEKEDYDGFRLLKILFALLRKTCAYRVEFACVLSYPQFIQLSGGCYRQTRKQCNCL
jgi:hypothetical protein